MAIWAGKWNILNGCAISASLSIFNKSDAIGKKGLFHFCNPECLDLDFFPIFMNFQPFQEHQRIQGTPAALQLPFAKSDAILGVLHCKEGNQARDLALLGIAGSCGDDYEMQSSTFNSSVTLSIDEKRQVMLNVTSSPSCYWRLSEQDRKVSWISGYGMSVIQSKKTWTFTLKENWFSNDAVFRDRWGMDVLSVFCSRHHVP